MARTLALVAAATMLLGSTNALAKAETAGYYTATPTEAPTRNSLITRDTVWKFRDGAFNAARAPEREIVLCQLIAQRVGKLSAFTAGGTAFDDDTLARCNAKAN